MFILQNGISSFFKIVNFFLVRYNLHLNRIKKKNLNWGVLKATNIFEKVEWPEGTPSVVMAETVHQAMCLKSLPEMASFGQSFI